MTTLCRFVFFLWFKVLTTNMFPFLMQRFQFSACGVCCTLCGWWYNISYRFVVSDIRCWALLAFAVWSIRWAPRWAFALQSSATGTWPNLPNLPLWVHCEPQNWKCLELTRVHQIWAYQRLWQSGPDLGQNSDWKLALPSWNPRSVVGGCPLTCAVAFDCLFIWAKKCNFQFIVIIATIQ